MITLNEQILNVFVWKHLIVCMCVFLLYIMYLKYDRVNIITLMYTIFIKRITIECMVQEMCSLWYV